MVSEPFVSSAESVMTNESNDEVFVLKFAPRLGFQLSNLKDIIDEHFNLPHVQVRCGKNGGVVLTGLFDAIPDDLESQDHESFDEINKLLGWIEGCIELPERSKSVAPKLFDESLRAMEESSDQHVHDEFEVTLANSDQISPKEVPLDEIPTCDVTNDDDMLIDEGLNVDNAVKGDEEMVQIELNDELILMKEFSDLVAHQVFDEMPRVMASHEINFDGPKLSGVASLGAVVNQPNRLHSKFDHDKVYPKLHKSALETYVNSVACLELHYFDPGGKGFRLSGSLISNESELVDELVDDEYDHKAMHVGSVSDQDDLKVFDMNDVKDAKPLLLAKSELTGLFKMPNKLTTQGRMMNGPVESLIFDPGGVKVACAHCAAQVLIGICADFCFHFGADSNGDQTEVNSIFQKWKLESNRVEKDSCARMLAFETGTDINSAETYLLKPKALINVNKNGEIVIFDPGIEEFMFSDLNLLSLNSWQNFMDACFTMRPFDPGVFLVMKGRALSIAYDALKLELVPPRVRDLLCTDVEQYGTISLIGDTAGGFVVNQHGLPTSEFDQVKVDSMFPQWMLGSNQVLMKTCVAKDYYDDMFDFDPGGGLHTSELVFEPGGGGYMPRTDLYLSSSRKAVMMRSWDILWSIEELFCAIFCVEEVTAEALSTSELLAFDIVWADIFLGEKLLYKWPFDGMKSLANGLIAQHLAMHLKGEEQNLNLESLEKLNSDSVAAYYAPFIAISNAIFGHAWVVCITEFAAELFGLKRGST